MWKSKTANKTNILIEIILKGINEDANWICLAENGNHRRANSKTPRKLKFLKKLENFLIIWAINSFSRSISLHKLGRGKGRGNEPQVWTLWCLLLPNMFISATKWSTGHENLLYISYLIWFPYSPTNFLKKCCHINNWILPNLVIGYSAYSCLLCRLCKHLKIFIDSQTV